MSRKKLRGARGALALLLCALPAPRAFPAGRADGPPLVRLNQAGYRARGVKVAAALSASPLPERFDVVEALAPFQDERAVYHDDVQDYSTNEPTMDGTASAVLLWALSAND